MRELVGPEKPPDRVQIVTRQLRTLVEGTSADQASRLPSERQLAARFQCSRNTVREALAALAAQGLVNVLGRVGAYCLPPAAPSRAPSDLEQALCALGITIPALARLAAQACAQAGVARLEALVSNLSQALLNRDATAAYRWCVAFFVALAETAGNEYLSRMLQELKDAAQLVAGGRLSRREQIEAFFSGMVELLQALRRGDGQDAGAIATRCVETFAAIMRTVRTPRKPLHVENAS